MTRRNTATAYGSVHRALHWIVALLVIPQLLIGDIILFLSPHNVPSLADYVHPTIGLLIGLLMLARIWWRSTGTLPDEPRDIGIVGQLLSTLTHYAFYLLLLINVVAGYLLACAGGLPIHFLFIPMPNVVGPGSTLDPFFFWLHLSLGIAIGAMVLLHIAGAVNHEFVLKDNVLRRMLGARMTRERQLRQERWPDGSPATLIAEPAPSDRA